MRREFWICGVLFLATLAVYWPVTNAGFTNFDDGVYVAENQMVQTGLNRASIVWAFTTGHATNWHPLTWISHELDCQLYGLKAGWHHLTSLLLHAVNVLLLFGLLRRMTGTVWRSALVAALFAWHPLHVESVAWVAERKDVLSTFFGLLALWAYARYVDETKTRGPWRKTFYGLALLLFLCALLSKPMLVTLPCLMLLLDYWPLNRISNFGFLARRSTAKAGRISDFKTLLVEKIPFFLLSAGSSIATLVAQSHGGAVSTFRLFPLSSRVANATVSYVRYLAKMAWPDDLSVFYPMPFDWPAWEVITSVLLLLAVTFIVVMLHQSRPWLAVGWLWYLGMLLPVIGLVQVGAQAMADRYSYVPLIGVFVMLAWGLAEVGTRWPQGRLPVCLLTGLVLAACLAATWTQVQTWQNSTTLFTHALEVIPERDDARIQLLLGNALGDAGHIDEAMEHYRAGLMEGRDYQDIILNNMGIMMERKGDAKSAADFYQRSMTLRPNMRAHYSLALALEKDGRPDEALEHYLRALEFPEARDAVETGEMHRRAGVILARQHKVDDALPHLREAVRRMPRDAEASYDLGIALVMQGRSDEAIGYYRNAVRLAPAWAEALNDLAWQLATNPKAELRNGTEAVRLAERACELGRGAEPRYLGTLDAAYAEVGRFSDAIETAGKARALALASGTTNVAEAAETRMALYKSGRPYHQQ